MIKSIRIVNCQSCKDVTYDLATDKLNVIVAENDTGKSVLFKVLKLVGCPKYYNRQERVNLIRRGANFGAIQFEFTDGSDALVKIYAEGVLYGYRDSVDSDIISGIEPPEQLLDKLGMLSDVDGKFVANIIDADQDLLLVNPALSYNNDLIEMLVISDDLTMLQEKVEGLLSDQKTRLSRVFDQVCFYEQELAKTEYEDTEALEFALKVSDAAFRVLYSFVDVWGVFSKGFSEDVFRAHNFEELISVESVLEKFEELSSGVKCLAPVKEPVSIGYVKVLESLDGVLERLGNFSFKKVTSMQVSTVDCLESLSSIVGKLSVLKECYEEIARSRDFASRLRMVDVLDSVSGVKSLADSIDLSGMKELKSVIAGLEEQFINSGKRVDCPIYGEVVFDGKNCMADSD